MRWREGIRKRRGGSRKKKGYERVAAGLNPLSTMQPAVALCRAASGDCKMVPDRV